MTDWTSQQWEWIREFEIRVLDDKELEEWLRNSGECAFTFNDLGQEIERRRTIREFFEA